MLLWMYKNRPDMDDRYKPEPPAIFIEPPKPGVAMYMFNEDGTIHKVEKK